MIHIVIADARTLRIFESAGSTRTLEEIAVFRNVAAGRHERDLVSDRPGRVVNSAARTPQSYEPRTRARLHSMQAWLRDLRPSLRELLRSRRSEGVVLVAAPRMLGELQRQLPPDIRKQVAGALPLDLARQPLAALKKRLQPAVRAAVRDALHAQPIYRPVITERRRTRAHV